MMNYDNEIWKDIVIEMNGVIYDYTELYQVSNFGRVRSLDRIDSNGHRRIKGKVLKLKVNNKGYQYVGLYKDGKSKQFYVHRIVATMFIPNHDNLLVINHRDENKNNNYVENLEWCTHKYNTNYGTRNERISKKRKGKPHTDEAKGRISESHKGDKNPKARAVICLETKQVFGCVREANEWIAKGNVSQCCIGACKTAGGYHWEYYDDYQRRQRMNTDNKNSKLIA